MQMQRIPSVAALGFRVQCNKWAIIVCLLLGEIPERTIFMQKGMEQALRPNFELKLFGHLSKFCPSNLPRLGFPWIRVRFTGLTSSPKKSVAGGGVMSASPNRFGPLQVGNGNDEEGATGADLCSQER
ncbi:hypothetical protein CMV_026573 [Castanea mollissima]|uniref:26S proteasome non-ATPase regulatory subunit 3 N-terminal TPR repeats domain-containing protein n=1 Tax=Castanea mollissima TaxID=60419 RepID=A0A8J4QCU2_9ROSI|nr:hypothetical protein CMV_026573 [Castanea mollissima]